MKNINAIEIDEKEMMNVDGGLSSLYSGFFGRKPWIRIREDGTEERGYYSHPMAELKETLRNKAIFT